MKQKTLSEILINHPNSFLKTRWRAVKRKEADKKMITKSITKIAKQY